MACARWTIKLASVHGGNRTICTRITCDQAMYGPPLGGALHMPRWASNRADLQRDVGVAL